MVCVKSRFFTAPDCRVQPRAVKGRQAIESGRRQKPWRKRFHCQ